MANQAKKCLKGVRMKYEVVSESVFDWFPPVLAGGNLWYYSL
jgi:hypothetical protein